MSPARKWLAKRLAARKPNPPRGETNPITAKKSRANFRELLASAGKQAHPTNWPGFALDGKPVRLGRFIRGSGTLL